MTKHISIPRAETDNLSSIFFLFHAIPPSICVEELKDHKIELDVGISREVVRVAT